MSELLYEDRHLGWLSLIFLDGAVCPKRSSVIANNFQRSKYIYSHKIKYAKY